MKLKKVYMPKWVAWFMLIIFIPMLIFMEYEAFFGEEPFPAMGIIMLFLFGGIIVMIFLMSYKKLPYLLVES
jgi:hypothetical protein